jgi:AraC family transcriptional regulator
MDKPAASRYHGDFVAWPGLCGFLGAGGGGAPIAPHAHYAIQLVAAPPPGLLLQFGRRGDWQPCAGALIPSRATHSIDLSQCGMSAVLFIEPETPAGRALTQRLQGGMELLDAAAVAAFVGRLDQAWRVERSHEAVRALCTGFVHEVSGTTARESSDARVLAAIATIHQRAGAPVTLAELAKAAHLSAGRFRHLFVEETGMPLRTYLLWRRLLHVWSLLMQGESLSAAAHAAGFADSAHLSRTARTMFGLPPSLLQVDGPLSARAAEAARPAP